LFQCNWLGSFFLKKIENFSLEKRIFLLFGMGLGGFSLFFLHEKSEKINPTSYLDFNLIET